MRRKARFRTGVVDFGLPSAGRPDLALRASRWTAAAAGIDTFFVADHLIGALPPSLWQPKYIAASRVIPDVNAHMECWNLLGYLAGRYPRTRMRFGVAVTDAGRRNPAVTAQAAATLHVLTRGRAILGLGPGERENNEPFGVAWDRPVARFEEAVATIRALWNSGGELVNRDSEFFPLRDAIFTVPPYRGTRPEMWIGGQGPRMLRITGQHGDAWCPMSFGQQPKDYLRGLDVVRTAAVNAGRDPDAVTPAAVLLVLAAPSQGMIDEITNSVGVRAFGLCVPAAMWARHGVEHPLGPDFSGLQDLLPHLIDHDTAMSYVDQVPPSLVREYCLAGTPGEIRDRLADWRDHGLRHALLLNLGSFGRGVRQSALAMKSFVQAVRSARTL
ncbi:LLM class flavin-dependent oxidoreductase [Lentzea sp. NPDC058436]|uniref:LLM class flavin-dependent oxidoreductase n=1 Tax=Lentzea sp. NPDC058436 TaxID=3346499 RepID=UPI00364678E6